MRALTLKNADIQIKEAAVEHASPRRSGSVDGLMGAQFKLKLGVKTEGKSKNGTPLVRGLYSGRQSTHAVRG